MGARGPAPKLRIVREREGNVSKERLPPAGVRLPAIPPSEPDWTELLPTRKAMTPQRRAEVVRARRIARARWRLWSKWLSGQQLLTPVDVELEDACLLVAEIDACRRDVALNGRSIRHEAGVSTNPAVRQGNQARGMLQPYLRAFGLTPLARDGLSPREATVDGDELFGG